MLEQIDRLALAVRDAHEAATSLNMIFDSVVVDDSIDVIANARRVTLQWGYDQLELYEPTGPGPVASFISSGKRGIFAGGFALKEPSILAEKIKQAGIKVSQQQDRFIIYPEDLRGTGVILSPIGDREKVGLIDNIWQITYTIPNLDEGLNFYRELFSIQDTLTTYYTSKIWGYDGAIAWFHPRKGAPLDSLEYLNPYEHEKAAGRFLAKTENIGGIYMASVHTDALPIVRERVLKSGGGWQESPNAVSTGFIHPKRTYGLLLGVMYYHEFDERRPTLNNPNVWNH